MKMVRETSFVLLVSSGFLCQAALAQQPLEDLFETGFILEDRNDDGRIDFVNAELVLGDEPSLATIAAAADIAVRLGYETMAMDLPLSGGDGQVGIAIGALAAAALGVETTELAEDEGLIITTRVEGRDWVVVTGRNDRATRLAATALSGRLPHLWDPDGPTFEDVLSDITASLSLDAVTPTSIEITRLVVREDRVSELAVRVEVPAGQRAITRARLLTDAPSYEHVDAVVLQLGDAEVRLPRAESATSAGPIPARPGASPKRSLDLSNLYTPDGLLGDADTNLIPDRIDAVLSPASRTTRTLDLAARLGLEATGMSVPLVRLPDEIDDAGSEPTLVVIGDHPLLDDETLPEESLVPGEGIIRVIPNAFGPKAAVHVGGDDEGLDRALEQLSERFPHVWERGKDRTTVDDIELDLWKFVSGRSPAGQASAALYKLDQIVGELAESDLRSARVLVSLEKPEPGFEEVVREHAERLGVPKLDIVIDDRDVQNAATIFDERFTIESEVDAFWKLFRDRVLPRVGRRDEVTVELRLSEPPAILEEISASIQKELGERADVRVFSAYKQGYSWLYDVIRPKLAAAGASSITIRFARYRPPLEWSQQAMHTPLRWLHEAFPIDEILARELGIDLSEVRFEAAPDDAPPYEVIATDAGGHEILRERFSPKLVLRPYIDRFRDYEMVNVTTGWLRVDVAGETILDQRIATDAERFWDHYQQTTIPAMYDYVMDRHDGNPRGAGKDAPLFGELEVELALSEPDYRLDLDQEIISTMDALHEDIYFTTLMFYRILGRNARGEELTYPGRVLPVMTAKADGKPGSARIRFTGFATSRPAVVVDYVESDGTEGSKRRDIPKVEVSRPEALSAYVRAGTEGLTRLELRVKVDTEQDERSVYIERARSEQVDERILSGVQVGAMIEHLDALRERGLYREALSYHGLGELVVRTGVEHEVDWESELRTSLRDNGVPAPVPDIHVFATGDSDQEIVQWDTPIPPPEAYGILARMAQYEEATVYKVGESYLGQDVWAMDLMPPIEASHLSRYKATTLKPTVIYSARQHANEVSSTSHVLKLAELLLTDPEHRRKLDQVNVVIHPITNPDGAQLAYDLYEQTPDLILHAGYYASLGMDVTSDGDQPMPIYPESTIRKELWNAWLPDIFLNPHGYPSHQLVQLFSEYTGLVRRGRITERNWSMNKGWFMPGFSYTDDPRFPRHKEAAFQIRDYITRAVGAPAEVAAMNERNYDRYRRYGAHFDEDEVFKLPMVNDILIHTAIKGDRAPAPGSSRGYNPKITIWSGTTEAPDETAYGDWMKLVATAGLEWDKAILQYLVDGDHKVERKGSSFFGGVSSSLDRPRPPKREEDEADPDAIVEPSVRQDAAPDPNEVRK